VLGTALLLLRAEVICEQLVSRLWLLQWRVLWLALWLVLPPL
jgi:hypothetical protein